MERSIKIAVVQMDAAPATLEEKLDRSGKFVAQCAEKGAGLVVLPELFNTGYEYSDRNYQQAESFDGPTSLWIRTTAAQYGLHLAGSFLRREGSRYSTLAFSLLRMARNGVTTKIIHGCGNEHIFKRGKTLPWQIQNWEKLVCYYVGMWLI